MQYYGGFNIRGKGLVYRGYTRTLFLYSLLTLNPMYSLQTLSQGLQSLLPLTAFLKGTDDLEAYDSKPRARGNAPGHNESLPEGSMYTNNTYIGPHFFHITYVGLNPKA